MVLGFQGTSSTDPFFCLSKDKDKNHADSLSQSHPVSAMAIPLQPISEEHVVPSKEEVREQKIEEVLEIISQSMNPPQHLVDAMRSRTLVALDTYAPENSIIKKLIVFLLGKPFSLARCFVNYFILEFYVIYNVTLLMVSIFDTPEIGYYILGFVLFWMSILFELYRDIVHRDDPFFRSNLSRELSLGAAMSASYGIVLKFKTQTGQITEDWWATWTSGK
ncbi:hypothetical protein CANARDRAFT_21803 [[Candida] arabinofermentans NRRL YB-2248]|uniref:Uncharacterized protein n=1 Tax=[Candida] arabinofermentans NRRL YB-2248 TaxID=983967 RepID=A0A1E4T4Z6_9ASCO|nr:hypothetical protein CANARDRAFT_21803 [[Candida] arabinofermentans NRRL YB-2248]